jgi:hypothetical protein
MSKLLTDHDEIRAWVAARAGNPAQISVSNGHGGFQTRLRLTFGQRLLNADGAGSNQVGGIELVPWTEWFTEFDKQQLGLRVPVQDDNAGSAYQLEKRGEN